MDSLAISMTDFVDFVVKAGLPKQTKVREIATRAPYHPKFDFWKSMREGICAFHQSNNSDLSALDEITNAADLRKKERYTAALRGYKKFIGRKETSIFPSYDAIWESSALQVRVHPELALVIEGQPIYIKLYFKDEKLTLNRLVAVLDLMLLTKPDISEAKVGVLDVAKGKIHMSPRPYPSALPLLNGEAASFVQMYNTIATQYVVQ